MSDEELGGQEAEEPSTIHHDDIVKRLLEYQRQLREGATPSEAAQRATSGPLLIDYSALEEQQAVVTGTEEVVDLTAAEAEAEAEGGAEAEQATATGGDLAERIAALERTLSDLVKDVHDLRAQSQSNALVVDDRLAAIQAKLAEATGGSGTES